MNKYEPEYVEQEAYSSRVIVVGDYVIVNDYDAPEDRLIAKIEDIIDEDIFTARYCNIQYALMRGITRPTLVEDFGRIIVIFRDAVATRTSGLDSTATYRDGEPRKWQGN